MQFIPIPFLALLFLACTNSERIIPENFVEQTVLLNDEYPDTPFCKVNLFVPIEFDTLLRWLDFSDCSCCGPQKYRFTASTGCLIKESGFFKTTCRDSFCHFTIENECVGNTKLAVDTVLLNQSLRYINLQNRDIGFPDLQWINQEIKNINGRPFTILHYFGQDVYTDRPHEKIIAGTIFNNTWIVFRWQCCQPDCTGFSTKAYQTLETIQIKEKG
jgi:hypothetical protein